MVYSDIDTARDEPPGLGHCDREKCTMQFNGITRRGVVVGGLSSLLLAGGFAVARPTFAQDSDEDAAPVAIGATPSVDGATVTVTHAQGETEVPFNPEKVIVFDLGSVDTLTTLGVSIVGLPKGNLSGMFDQFNDDAYENVGSLFEPDYETVNAIGPDLIIVSGRSAAVLPELAKIAPTIDVTGQTGDAVADLAVNARLFGEIFGKQAEAEAALTAIEARIEEIKAGVNPDDTALVIMTTGGNLTAIAPGGTGRGSRGGLVYGTLGVPAPVDDVEAATHGEPISFEFLLEHNPTWLVVIDRDTATGSEEGVAAQEMLDNEIVHQTSAWQDEKIIYVNPYDWYIVMGGLTTVANMVEELAPMAGLGA